MLLRLPLKAVTETGCVRKASSLYSVAVLWPPPASSRGRGYCLHLAPVPPIAAPQAVATGERAAAAAAAAMTAPPVGSNGRGSPALLRLYLVAVHHPQRWRRVAAMGLVFMLMLLRSAGLFTRELAAAAAGCVLAGALLRVSYGAVLAAAALLGLQAWCWLQAALRVEHVAGHRAGAEGYDGELVENTIEAMRALIARDNGPDGPLPDLHYVEVDVHETSDGELVVVHDVLLDRSFPPRGPNVAAYKALGCSPSTTAVQELTSAQLRSLHLAGRPGLHAPLLGEFMAALRDAGCRRPLVVEIKRISSDTGRARLLQLLREHFPFAAILSQQFPQFAHPQLGFLGVISFPHLFAASFGEFGSAQWRRWARAFVDAGVPAAACFLERLSYTRGA